MTLKEIQEYYDRGFSIEATAAHFEIPKSQVQGKIKTRSLSESIKRYRSTTVNPATRADVRLKISKSMKKAIKEGRAKGWSSLPRHKRKRSYPELFFEKVINQEFTDKEYVYEHPVSIYSIDFAWLHKKRAIEIDGGQHKYRKELDKKKDVLLVQNGWTVLRIDWSDLCKFPQKYVKIAKDFIDAELV